MNNSDESSWTVLCRIADALDVPVERFLTRGSPPELTSGSGECLRLWSKLRTEQGRCRALEALRTIAAEEDG